MKTPISLPCFIAAATLAATLFATPVTAADQNENKQGADQPDPVEVIRHDGEAAVLKTLQHKTFSQDGRLFAGYYRDGFDEVISIHDAKSRKQLRRIVGHGDDVRAFKFTSDGKLLASRCANRHREGWALWDVATGELLLRLPLRSPAAEDD